MKTKSFKSIYQMGPLKRSIIIWALFQIVLWLVFLVSYYINTEAWNIVSSEVQTTSNSVLSGFLYIIGMNSILFFIIVIGNIFVRFGLITLGPIILLLQGIMIGYVAGTNSFEFPFINVVEANLQYLRVGLWETTAYALICAVTMTKSLYISDSFPAKKWIEVRTLREIRFSLMEKIIIIVSIILLITVAYIEAFLLYGF